MDVLILCMVCRESTIPRDQMELWRTAERSLDADGRAVQFGRVCPACEVQLVKAGVADPMPVN